MKKEIVHIGHTTYYLSDHKDNLEDLYNEVINLPPVNNSMNTVMFRYPEQDGAEFTFGNYDGIDIWYNRYGYSYSGELTFEKFKEVLMYAALGYHYCLRCKKWFDRTTPMRNVWAGLYCPECFATPEIKKKYNDMMSYHD